MSDAQRGSIRCAGAAAASGRPICGLGFGIIILVWPATRWMGSLADLTSLHRLVLVLLANSVVLICGYFATAALIWGIAECDHTAQPRDFRDFAAATASDQNLARRAPVPTTSTPSASAMDFASRAEDPGARGKAMRWREDTGAIG